MNAAARALAQGIIITHAPTSIRRISISRQAITIIFLVAAVISSALAVITLNDNNRVAFGDLASLQQQRDNYQTSYGQLLLEENTWSAPSRVETIAQQNLSMSQPDQRNVIIIKP